MQAVPQGQRFERLLRRNDAITLVALLVLCVLAWAYIATGARLGASAWEMSSLALFPHRYAAAMAGMAGMPDMAPGPGTWLLLVAMWAAMMVAMMTPSAAPTILLYARVHRQGGAGAPVAAPVGAFALGYLSMWLAFSVAAASLQLVLEESAVVSTMTMGLQSRWPAGALLVAAGLYQLTPIKRACLSHCRAPAAFLSQHWRAGAAGAFRLGLLHGAFCLGCCWLLMALLFVGGVMNLAWIAAIGVLVLVEKLAGPGVVVGRVTGALLVAWGLATFLA